MSDTVNPKTSVLRRSAIAACVVWPTDRHSVFFQDNEGGIRHIRYMSGSYTEGDKYQRLMVANNAKWYTPLAAVTYDHGSVIKNSSGTIISQRVSILQITRTDIFECYDFKEMLNELL
jgi:hypothetical protein